MSEIDYPKSLQVLFQKFLAKSSDNRGLLNAQVRLIWHREMPVSICDRTEKLYVHEHKLFLKISTPALRYELAFNKGKILTLFHTHMAHLSLKEVVLL